MDPNEEETTPSAQASAVRVRNKPNYPGPDPNLKYPLNIIYCAGKKNNNNNKNYQNSSFCFFLFKKLRMWNARRTLRVFSASGCLQGVAEQESSGFLHQNEQFTE